MKTLKVSGAALLVLALGLSLAGSVEAKSTMSKMKSAMPASVFKATLPADVDLSGAQNVEIRDANHDVMMSGTFVDGKAELTGTNCKGKLETEVTKKNGVTRQELEGVLENLAPSTAYKVYVDGKNVGSFVSNKNGKRGIKFERTDRD